MSTYVVGDLQGCLEPLHQLLDRLRFDPAGDRLLLTGDLVARGPDSLGALRFVRQLGAAALTVLGNHDLHLIALWRGYARKSAGPDLAQVLDAPDADELLDWLRQQRLAWREPTSGALLIHAGLAPQWTPADTLGYAAEIETILRDDQTIDGFLPGMYGDQPDRWSEQLQGIERQRFIVNTLTRARYCTVDGRFEFRQKGAPGSQRQGWLPWFQVPGRRSQDTAVAFGHWSALGQVVWPQHRVYGLDSGYVWGGALTALCLEDGRLLSIRADTAG